MFSTRAKMTHIRFWVTNTYPKWVLFDPQKAFQAKRICQTNNKLTSFFLNGTGPLNEGEKVARRALILFMATSTCCYEYKAMKLKKSIKACLNNSILAEV